MTRQCDTARELYDTLGFDTIPILPGDKRPAAYAWQNRTPYRLWRNAPEDANIGVRGGGPAHLAIVDCDEPQTFEAVTGWLAGLGVMPDEAPVVRSASGEGRHVYLTMTGLPGDWRKLAKDIGGGELRYGAGSYVVAPPSVVAGSMYALIAGDFRQLPRVIIRDILPILANQDVTAAPRPVIPRRAVGMLNGQLIENYSTRSEAEQSLIVSLVNAGHTFDQVRELFDRYPCAGKYAELRAQGSKKAERWLRTSYDKAAAWTQANESQARQLAANAIAWAESTPWPGRTGAVNQSVYLAHANIAYRKGATAYKDSALIYAAACRDLAEQAGIGKDTATRATWRLIRLGLLAKEREAVADCANIYRLNGRGRLPLDWAGKVSLCGVGVIAAAAIHDSGTGRAHGPAYRDYSQSIKTHGSPG